MQDLKAKLAEAQARGNELQQLVNQLVNQLEMNKLELAKVCGQIELLKALVEEDDDADENSNS